MENNITISYHEYYNLVKDSAKLEVTQNALKHGAPAKFILEMLEESSPVEDAPIPPAEELAEEEEYGTADVTAPEPPEVEAPESESEPEPEPTHRKRIDIGKIMALKNAGWRTKDIAEEMGMKPDAVSQAIYAYNKKKEKNNDTTEAINYTD
jgi:hypothetical protein